MAKAIIEKAPFKFDIKAFEDMYDVNYLHYKSLDEKGKYLYWDKFKWRVKEGDDPEKAWWATKFARLQKQKTISLVDKNNKNFNFCIPDNLEAKLFKISSSIQQEMNSSDMIKNKYLISSLIMEEAISSSQLEGAVTTREIAKKMLSLGRKAKDEDERMILNNYFLMQEVKRIKEEDLSIDMILDLHQIATKDTGENSNIAGELRQKDSIVVSDGEGNILHQPPSFKDLQSRLQNFCDFANEEHLGADNTLFIHPIIKAIILHFMIGYEHPFADGNGRTARAIFYWFMLKNGFDYFEYISISKLLKKAPKQYGLSYLYSEIDDNDLSYFIYYQVDIILRSIDALVAYLELKSKEFKEITKLLDASKVGRTLNFVQKDIVKKSIKEAGRIFIVKEIATDYDISENTARSYLKKLVEHKILIAYKEGRSVGYIAPSNLREIF